MRGRARRGDAPLLPVKDAELVVEISGPGIEPTRLERRCDAVV